MTEQDDVRNDLDVDVFAALGKTVTLVTETGTTYNERGEVESVTSTNSTVTIVPYNIEHERLTQNEFGDLSEGEMEAVVRYDQAIDLNDKFIIESQYWKVSNVEKSYLPDNVATIVRLIKTGDVILTYQDLADSDGELLLDADGEQLEVLE